MTLSPLWCIHRAHYSLTYLTWPGMGRGHRAAPRSSRRLSGRGAEQGAAASLAQRHRELRTTQLGEDLTGLGLHLARLQAELQHVVAQLVEELLHEGYPAVGSDRAGRTDVSQKTATK